MLRQVKIRALTLALGALLLAGTLSACGGSSSVKSEANPVALAAEKTVAVKTVQVSGTITETMSSLPAPVTMTFDGVNDLSGHRASMTMDMSQMAVLGGSALGSPSDWKIEAVMDGLVMYMKAPFFQTMLKTDKPWVKIDMESAGNQMGLDLSSLMSGSPDQWTQSLNYLLGAKDTELVGPDFVRGVKTKHYTAKIDFDRYLEMLPADKRAAAKESLDNLRKLADPKYGAFDVWVDAQKRIRREKFSFTEKIASSGTMSMTMDMEFHDYDVPAVITIPPADQVVDLNQLAGSLGSG